MRALKILGYPATGLLAVAMPQGPAQLNEKMSDRMGKHTDERPDIKNFVQVPAKQTVKQATGQLKDSVRG